MQGAAGLGDPLFPELGNGGYDVQHYTLDLEVDPAANGIAATTTIRALATETLKTFNLDFHGLTVDGVMINDEPGAFKRVGDELIVTPATPLRDGVPFTTTIAYHGRPSPLADPAIEFSSLGWLQQDSVIYTINEPNGAMNWFPGNNHPLDKATYTLRITVPATLTAASNGVLEEVIDNGDTSTFVWEMRQPMASYLAAVYIGDFTRVDQAGLDGLPLRYYFPAAERDRLLNAFDAVPEMLAFYTDLFGPYPFDAYGGVVVPYGLGYAMENQTMNLFGLDSSVELVIAHELMHEWFGNNVSLSNWQDIWLNEGFAYYIPFLWAEATRGVNLDAMMESFYRQVSHYGSVGSATVDADEMFGASVYQRGALTLHALRKLVGEETFYSILRTYYTRHAGGNATTADFIAAAEEVSGQELADFFHSWLYEDELPPLPGGNP